MKINKPKLIMLFVFIFLVSLRILFRNNEYLDTIVAMINFVALYIVVFDIAEKIKNNTITKIVKSCDSKQIALREKRKYIRIFYAALILVNLAFTAIYFGRWCSGLGNDIISIVALGLSVLDEEAIALGNYLYKV